MDSSSNYQNSSSNANHTSHIASRSLPDHSPLRGDRSATSSIHQGDHGRLTHSTSPKRRNSLSVRLTKTSSARPLLYSKVHSEALWRIANLLESSEKAKTDVTTGRLPVEAAYVVMKRVTEATGHPILSTGLSTFNKLNSLSTEPVLDVLKNQTWRDFFHQTDPKVHSKQSRLSSANFEKSQGKSTAASMNPPSSQGSAMSRSKSAFTVGNRPAEENSSEQEKFQELRNKSFQLLNELGEIMIDRIRSLWKLLRIPKKEQTFYEKSICSLPIQSLEQCQELSKLIFVLQQHEQQTKKVLLSIKQREAAVGKCFDVLQALQRKFFTSPIASSTSSVTLAKELTQGQMFWKEELILSLLEVRSTSMEVLKAIQDWRRSLWRPVSFLWRGRDYLLKMKMDFEAILGPNSESPIMKIIEMLPLSVYDLQGIIFLSPDLKPGSSQLPSSRSASFTPFQTASATGGERFPGQSQPNLHYQAYIDSLLQQYHNSYSTNDLESAATVVIQEESLQKAIQLEQQALTNKGVFIPILRPINDLSNDTLRISQSPARSERRGAPPLTASRPPSSSHKDSSRGYEERSDKRSSPATTADPSMEPDMIVVTSGSNFSSVKRPQSATSNNQFSPHEMGLRPPSSATHPEEETSLDSPSKYKDDFSPQ